MMHYSIFLFLFVQSIFGTADPLLLSREYKFQLDPSLFTGNDPSSAVDDVWNDVQNRATALGCTFSGSLPYDQSRTIIFYDTPTTCVLRKNGFVLRARSLSEDEEPCTTDREITLKYLSKDRYNSSHTDVSSASKYPKGCYDGTKFEEDINPVFDSKFSYSNSVQVPDKKNINKIQDTFDIFPNALEGYGINTATPLSPVSGLTVYENRYKGGKVNLPSKKDKQAKFTLTLWYDSADSTQPFVSELSFTVEDKDESWKPKISIQKMGELYNSLQSASYARLDLASKTQSVYNYGSSCGGTGASKTAQADAHGGEL